MTPTAYPSPERNMPDFAGRQASKKVLFGKFSRYALYAIHTRGDAVQWVVADAEVLDDLGFPKIIRQATTPQKAIDGLI